MSKKLCKKERIFLKEEESRVIFLQARTGTFMYPPFSYVIPDFEIFSENAQNWEYAIDKKKHLTALFSNSRNFIPFSLPSRVLNSLLFQRSGQGKSILQKIS